MKWGHKLPTKQGTYIVTLKTDSFGSQVRQAVFYIREDGFKYWCILPEHSVHTSNVIAWFKQPEPYKETKQ